MTIHSLFISCWLPFHSLFDGMIPFDDSIIHSIHSIPFHSLFDDTWWSRVMIRWGWLFVFVTYYFIRDGSHSMTFIDTNYRIYSLFNDYYISLLTYFYLLFLFSNHLRVLYFWRIHSFVWLLLMIFYISMSIDYDPIHCYLPFRLEEYYSTIQITDDDVSIILIRFVEAVRYRWGNWFSILPLFFMMTWWWFPCIPFWWWPFWFWFDIPFHHYLFIIRCHSIHSY